MIITGKRLPRRTFLRGMGTIVALPMLDAMVPAFARRNSLDLKAPVRMAFAYVPNGIVMNDWTPKALGKGYEFTRILKPLEALREDIMVLSNLDSRTGNALGDGPGDHARAGASFLTGVHCRKTAGADIQGGVSVDQIAAAKLTGATRFSSLELGPACGLRAFVRDRRSQSRSRNEGQARKVSQKHFRYGERRRAEPR